MSCLIFQKGEQGTIVSIFRAAQVRVCNEQVSHAGHYSEPVLASQGFRLLFFKATGVESCYSDLINS